MGCGGVGPLCTAEGLRALVTDGWPPCWVSVATRSVARRLCSRRWRREDQTTLWKVKRRLACQAGAGGGDGPGLVGGLGRELPRFLAASPDPCWGFSGSGNQFQPHQDFYQAQRCTAVCCREIGYFMQNTQNSFFLICRVPTHKMMF